MIVHPFRTCLPHVRQQAYQTDVSPHVLPLTMWERNWAVQACRHIIFSPPQTSLSHTRIQTNALSLPPHTSRQALFLAHTHNIDVHFASMNNVQTMNGLSHPRNVWSTHAYMHGPKWRTKTGSTSCGSYVASGPMHGREMDGHMPCRHVCMGRQGPSRISW